MAEFDVNMQTSTQVPTHYRATIEQTSQPRIYETHVIDLEWKKLESLWWNELEVGPAEFVFSLYFFDTAGDINREQNLLVVNFRS